MVKTTCKETCRTKQGEDEMQVLSVNALKFKTRKPHKCQDPTIRPNPLQVNSLCRHSIK